LVLVESRYEISAANNERNDTRNHQLGDEAMTTLEQEVRTLQKQVRRQRRWHIAMVAIIFACSGCQTNRNAVSEISPSFEVDRYTAVTITPDDRFDRNKMVYDVSFIEADLEEVFVKLGFEVLGHKQVGDYKSGGVISVRYIGKRTGVECSIKVFLDDESTGKKLLACSAASLAFGAPIGADLKTPVVKGITQEIEDQIILLRAEKTRR
jgi:hypothetical protein